jgi:hypothetical protein
MQVATRFVFAQRTARHQADTPMPRRKHIEDQARFAIATPMQNKS